MCSPTTGTLRYHGGLLAEMERRWLPGDLLSPTRDPPSSGSHGMMGLQQQELWWVLKELTQSVRIPSRQGHSSLEA
ncbi:unnamed protein product [Arctogadus glacialis]